MRTPSLVPDRTERNPALLIAEKLEELKQLILRLPLSPGDSFLNTARSALQPLEMDDSFLTKEEVRPSITTPTFASSPARNRDTR
jgi:hypothetical protein